MIAGSRVQPAGIFGKLSIPSRSFFWGRSKAINEAQPLIEKEEEMKIMQYRGRLDDFNKKSAAFESYLRGEDEPSVIVENASLIQGRCTGEGSLRFKERAMAQGIPGKNFRKPFDLPVLKDPSDAVLNLSTVGLGTYLGKPDDEDDFDQYIALKYLLKSGTLNFIDTAINYRC